MKFVIYNVENCRTRENRVGKRSIRFNSVTGNMYLSTKLAKEMNYHNERPTGVWL